MPDLEPAAGGDPQVVASATGSSCIAFAVRFPSAYWDRRSSPQRTFIPDKDGSVTTALIFVTNSGERGSRSYNFGYKDMDETMGPCEPVAASILRHLSALDLENGGEVAKWAQAWRDRCKAYSAARSIRPQRGQSRHARCAAFVPGRFLGAGICRPLDHAARVPARRRERRNLPPRLPPSRRSHGLRLIGARSFFPSSRA
jgi:hypothetical protein